MDVDHEITLLVGFIKSLGSPNSEGKVSVKFGTLFKDDGVANTLESLVGTLKAAKKRGIIQWPGQMLLSPMNDDVDIVLLADTSGDSEGEGEGNAGGAPFAEPS